MMQTYFKILNSALIITINIGLWALIVLWFDPESLNSSWNNGDKASYYSVHIVTVTYALMVMLICAYLHVGLSNEIENIFKHLTNNHKEKTK